MNSFWKKFRTIRPARVAVLFLGLYASAWGQAERDDQIPQSYPADRYESLWKKSPFTLSSAATESTAGFTDNLALTGVVRIDGEYYAAILDKTTQKRELISSKPNGQGLKLVKTELSDELAKVMVTLEKGGETSILRYDLNFIPPPSQAAAPQNKAANGSATNASTPSIPRLPNTPPPTTRIPKRRVIPSNSPAQKPPNSNNQPFPNQPKSGTVSPSEPAPAQNP